jgi:PAS domain S-box-containing protein
MSPLSANSSIDSLDPIALLNLYAATAGQSSSIPPGAAEPLALYREIFINASDGIAIIGADFRYLVQNPAHATLTGFSDRELVGKTPAIHMGEEAFAAVMQVVMTRGWWRGEILSHTKNGDIPIDLSAYAVNDASGQPICYVGVRRDISRRRQVEDALRRSEQRYRSLVSATAQVVWVTNAGGEVVEDLPTWRAFTGQTFEQLKGFGWTSAVHPDDQERVAKIWQESLRNGLPHEKEFRVRAADGSFRDVIARAVPVMNEDDGSIREWVGTVTDITRQKTAEHARQRSEQRFRKLIEQSPLSTQIYSPDGRPVQCNRAWERLFGVTMADLPDYNVLHDEQLVKLDVMDTIRRGFAGEAGAIEPIPYIPPVGMYAGQARWISATIYPVKDEAGAVREVVLVHEDVSERKAADEALRRANAEAEAASKAKDQFIAVLSHELRTPLTPVLAMVSALERQLDLPQAVRDDLQVVRRNVELEVKLIDDLLDLTRITKGKLQLNLEPVDVIECINRVIGICRDDLGARGLTLKMELPEPGCCARADSARLQQVLWNLLKNAIKFSPPQGEVIVRAANLAESKEVRIEVIDTGIGIDPAAMPKLFNAFVQAEHAASHRFGGLGLGLTISRYLAEAHGGTLTAFSAGVARGATFTLTLPAASEVPTDPAGAGAPGGAASAAAPAARAVLLVEDHHDTAQIMMRMLRHWNYDVEWADNFGAALRAVDRRQFDLLVSDLGLPDGSGLDLMREIRQRYPIRGIALSGYGMEEDVHRSRDAGFADHLIKPVSLDVLRASLETVAAISPEPAA